MQNFDNAKARDPRHLTRPQLVLEVERLRGLINTPHTDEFLSAVQLEAAHQIERWGTAHDECKTPLDWFWLVGYLAQKAATAALCGDTEKAKHHTISTAACMLNWFRRLTGDDATFQPGSEVAAARAEHALAE